MDDACGQGRNAALTGVRRLAAARAIAGAWRRLCGGRDARDHDRATLVACSAGVDSSALALVLGTTGARIVVGHVVHDLRDADAALADRDAARELAGVIGAAFLEREAPVRGLGENLEGAARRARYAALAEMAKEAGCGFVVTAHHAEDQLETVLMRLMRGAGPKGLAGILPTRVLGRRSDGLVLARPMLGVGRAEAVAVCGAAGWAWREDASNRDESFLRNAVRARVMPEVLALRSDAARRAAVTAEVCRLSGEAITREARRVLNRATAGLDGAPRAIELDRRVVASAALAVRCEAIRLVIADFGGTGLDRAGFEVLRPAGEAIGDRSTEPRKFTAGSIVIAVTAHGVRVTEAQSDG